MIPVGVVLHQGSSLSPYLLAMIMDVLARGIKDISPWCMLYADDIELWGTRSEVVENKLEEWRWAMENRWLKINRKKTVYLRFNVDRNLDGNSDINIQGDNLEQVNTFKYLGTTLAENGDDASLSSSFPFVRGEVLPATFSPPHLIVFSTLLCLLSSSSSLPPRLPSSHLS